MTETIGSGFPNFVLGMLLADSTITRSMAGRGQEGSAHGVGKTRALELTAAPPKESPWARGEGRGEAMGGPLADYLLKAVCKLIPRPEPTTCRRHRLMSPGKCRSEKDKT